MSDTQNLLQAIVIGMQELKAQNIVTMDLSTTGSSVSDYFVVCEAESNTHVKSIADSVLNTVREEAGERAIYKEGYENGQWILIDYSDVVVHVFDKEYREFYNIEGLWADAKIERIEEI